MDLRLAVAASMLPASRSRVSAVYKEHRHLPGCDALAATMAACGMGPEAAGTLDAACRSAEAALSAAARLQMEPVPWFDRRYPVLLDCIPDPPPVLWVLGDAESLARPAVAIVGSRAATPYAREMGERLGAELAACGVIVASGLARGVDSAAHRGCLGAGGRTVAVLGSGLDRIYPTEHDVLAATISRSGALVSELGPGAPPLPEHFPLRNRVISGISLAVVVVEASEKSGSLITARYALEQGRDVMAVPGSALSGRNRGSHALLKDGAKVVENADDILQELGWPSSAERSAGSAKLLDTDPLLARMESGEEYRLDDLMRLTGVSGPKLLPRLMELQLQGRVSTTPAGRFCRAGAK